MNGFEDRTAFAEWLHALLNAGGFADDLGWEYFGAPFEAIVEDALILARRDDVVTTSPLALAQLRAAGEVALWRRVVAATVHYADNRTTDGSQASLSQIHEQARRLLAEAEARAGMVGLIVRVVDPFAVIPVRYSATRRIDEFGTPDVS